MKSSEAIKKAVDFYESNGLTVIYRQAGVSPRIIAKDPRAVYEDGGMDYVFHWK